MGTREAPAQSMGADGMKHKTTARSFVKNVRRAMQVAGASKNGYPEKLTQDKLSKASGVARSTLAMHVELDADSDRSPNPKLEQICRIADALDVPPAFLLMRDEDWTRLAQAINYYAELRRRGRHPVLLEGIAAGVDDDVHTQALDALRLAKSMEIDGRPSSALLEDSSPTMRNELLKKTAATARRIFASASLPPMSTMEPDARLAAFVISVVFAANYQPETERKPKK